MERPTQYEHFRYVGDKRTQIVYDIDDMAPEDAAIIEELMESRQYLGFGPDTLAEAANRGYRLWPGQA